ncbi:MAG: hypothetical protein J5J06_14260 [Phycisphaerae bacterium]|nr:hypothetical protein [Phycisphaerae bacterium]
MNLQNSARSLTGRLRHGIRRVRMYLVVEGLLVLAAFLVGMAAFQLLCDYYSRGLQWSMRAALLGVVGLGAVWILIRRVLEPWLVRFEPGDLAHCIERRHPGLEGSLVSAVRFAAGETGAADANSPGLMASAVHRTVQATASLDFLGVLKPSRPRWASAGLVMIVAACVGVSAWQPELIGLWFARNVLLQDVEWPRRTRLVVELHDGALLGARGDDLAVQAWAEGVQPREVEIRFETESGRAGQESMTTVGNPGSYRYRYLFPAVQDELRFQLRGGDDRTDWIPVRLVERPQVVESRMLLTPPAYTRQEPVLLGDDQRVARVLAGTEVELRIHTNKPVEQSTLMSGADVIQEATFLDGWYVARMRASESATLHFNLRDAFGFEDRKPTRFSLRVMKDDPPIVRMSLSGVGEMITPAAVVPIEVEFRDLYGLATAELVYVHERKDGGSEKEKLIPLSSFRSGPPQFSDTVTWAVMNEAVEPGDRLTLFARASDFDDVNGPNEAQSAVVALRVVTVEEFLAEMARREQEYRMDLERLVDAQERVRSELLTWRREAEAGAGADSVGAALAPLERRQRHIAGSINVLRQQFDAVLTELQVNRLDVREERERLEDGIIEPLSRIATRDAVLAADRMRDWSRDPNEELGFRMDEQQVQVLEAMRAVLARMVQWEGYHEVVNMLRDIIRLQREMEEETRKAREKEVEGLFED